MLAVPEDGRAWRVVEGVRRLPEWAWAGRTLFALTGQAQELSLPPTPGRYVRLEMRLPARGERPIASVCVRGEPRS